MRERETGNRVLDIKIHVERKNDGSKLIYRCDNVCPFLPQLYPWRGNDRTAKPGLRMAVPTELFGSSMDSYSLILEYNPPVHYSNL